MTRADAPLPVCIETTEWKFVFAVDAPQHREATRRFFDQVRTGGFEVYIAKLVLDEGAAASEPRRTELMQLINELAGGPRRTSASAPTARSARCALVTSRRPPYTNG